MNEIDPSSFRDTLGTFATGVVIATGAGGSAPAGFAAQSFFALSLEPPLVGLCPAKTSSSWPRIRAAGHFCINVLGEHQKPVCDVFARSGIDKFAEIGWRPGVTGSPILDGVKAYVDCRIVAEHDAGDHTIAVGRVLDLAVLDARRGPLLFFKGRYGRFDAL